MRPLVAEVEYICEALPRRESGEGDLVAVEHVAGAFVVPPGQRGDLGAVGTGE
ncbi:MAG: hypothetical protein M3O70_09710 [Actinomycetota bacterium]|nr:hypothetical protein [Actinomycetota bacterium]